jgi:hypothetical protein
MFELLFWILVIIFSSVGTAQIICFIKRLIFKDTIPENIVVIVKKDQSINFEARIRCLVSQINFNCSVAVVDFNDDENEKNALKSMADKLNIDFIDKSEIINYLQK